ncbi:MAG: hypothetical protein RLZZ543_2314 [Bacteroidota bacterium]|jgi:hypothetical protein
MRYYHIDSIDDFDFSGDDLPSKYATSVVYADGFVGYVIAVLIPEIALMTSGVFPENELEFSDLLHSFNADLYIGKDTSTLIVSDEEALSKYALMQIKWDDVVIEKLKTPIGTTLQPEWYPFHFNFNPIERMAWNQLVKVVLGRK